jgi:arginase family enzyme
VSVLRARCPDCGTLTAVALDEGYECHVCGRSFAAGLVRVPRAFGTGGEAMAAAALLDLPYPEAAVVEEASVEGQAAALAAALPTPPLVLGGCCCAHVGAIRGLAARHGRISVVWLDAHGDLNTPETSPSGNLWGMPLRMAIDEGSVAPGDVALWGARDLDPPEEAFMAEHGIDDDVGRAVTGTAAVYVALDVDVLAPGELACFMPVEGGPTLAVVEGVLRDVASLGVPVAGLGLTGLTPEAGTAPLLRLVAPLGL